jgi:hypothetical protein
VVAAAAAPIPTPALLPFAHPCSCSPLLSTCWCLSFIRVPACLYPSPHSLFMLVYTHSAACICLAFVCIHLAYPARLFTLTHAGPSHLCALALTRTSSRSHWSRRSCWPSFVLGVAPAAAAAAPTGVAHMPAIHILSFCSFAHSCSFVPVVVVALVVLVVVTLAVLVVASLVLLVVAALMGHPMVSISNT